MSKKKLLTLDAQKNQFLPLTGVFQDLDANEKQQILQTLGVQKLERYVWVKYSKYENGRDQNNNPDMHDSAFVMEGGIKVFLTYMGIAMNQIEQTPSNIPEDYTWSRIKGTDGENGKSNFILDLTNDNSSVPATYEGELIAPVPPTKAIVYNGTQEDTGWQFSAQWYGCAGTINQITGDVNVTSLNLDSATVTIAATKSGNPALTAIYSISKVRAGSPGEDPIIYYLLPGATVIKIDKTGGITPAVLTCSQYKRVGNLEPVLTTDKVIKYQIDNQAEQIYQSGITVLPAYKVIVFKLYDGNTVMDLETIHIIKDGSDGNNGTDGDSTFKSSVFIRSSTVPQTPTGGNWGNPVPQRWSDGIPEGDLPIYMSTRIFTRSGNPPQQNVWTTPQLMSNTSELEIKWSDYPSNNYPENPDENPGAWIDNATESVWWMAVRYRTNGVWSTWQISRIKGENGSNGHNGDGYEFSYALTERDDNPPDVNYDNDWLGTGIFPPVIGNTQTLWMRQRIAYGTGFKGPWQGPIKLTGDDGTSIQGPSMAYRGDWSELKQYSGSQYVVDIVKYVPNGRGYMAKTSAGQIPVGTLPTNTQYWQEFTSNIDSIFTDFLFAYSGYIQNLTVGQLQTNTEGERTTIGFKPTDSQDPTRVYSKHSPRGYYPSGRVNWILSYIPASNPITLPDGKIISDAGALVFYKDELGSPIHSVIDTKSSTVNYNTPELWSTDNLLFLHAITDPRENLDGTATEAATNYNNAYVTPNGVNRYLYSRGNNADSRLNEPFEGYHTDQFKSFLNFIPDGWYTYGNYPFTAGRTEPTSSQYNKGIICLRIWKGRVNVQLVYFNPNKFWIEW